MIAIDYLKIRAIYDAYAKKNTLVNFISSAKEEEKKEDEGNERDLSDLLYDFGDNLKMSTVNRGQVSLQNSHTFHNMSKLNSSSMTRKQSVLKPVTEKVDLKH